MTTLESLDTQKKYIKELIEELKTNGNFWLTIEGVDVDFAITTAEEKKALEPLRVALIKTYQQAIDKIDQQIREELKTIH